MGRKKLNRTDDEIREQWRARRMRYYNRHKRLERKRALDRYYKNKGCVNVIVETKKLSEEMF